jgi:hypothetical protein
VIDHRPNHLERLPLNLSKLIPQLRRNRSPDNISGPADRTPVDAFVLVVVPISVLSIGGRLLRGTERIRPGCSG